MTIRPWRVFSPGESSPRGIIPLGNHPPGESFPWGITPWGIAPWGIVLLGNHPPWGIVPLGNHLPGEKSGPGDALIQHDSGAKCCLIYSVHSRFTQRVLTRLPKGLVLAVAPAGSPAASRGIPRLSYPEFPKPKADSKAKDANVYNLAYLAYLAYLYLTWLA